MEGQGPDRADARAPDRTRRVREELVALEREVDERVDAAVAYATADEAPRVEELAAGVYAPGSAEQFERMRPGSPFGELELVFNSGLGR